MWAYVSVFSTPKRCSTPSECEDAYWVSPNGNGAGDVTERSLRIVVADGASESLLAGKWARSLSATFGTTPVAVRSRPGFLSAYQTAVAEWPIEVARYIDEREQRGVPIQWFEESGLSKGAFSTIIALDVARTGPWRATALGDSCVFQVRDERVLFSFPLHDLDDFSNHPPLLPSRAADVEIVRRNVAICRGDWVPGDSFYVVTDALAAWFLRANSETKRPWEPLRDLGTEDFELDFSSWVDLQRDQGALRDDDTTLVRIDLY
jgi:hypothetical protein